MALTDQPYFPLYVDDYLTDEKLLMCDSSSEGVYNRILCHLHKSDQYGKIIINDFEKAKLKQKLSKTQAKIDISFLNVEKDIFYLYVEKILLLTGRDYETVLDAMIDLIGHGVLRITDGVLWQKRMWEDGQKSINKAKNGSLGGKSAKQNTSKTQAKHKQSPVNVIETENGYKIRTENENENEKIQIIHDQKIILKYLNKAAERDFKMIESNLDNIRARLRDGNTIKDCKDVIDLKVYQSTIKRKSGEPEFDRQYLRPSTLFNPKKFEGYLQDVKDFKNGKQETSTDSDLEKIKKASKAIPNDFFQ